MIEGLKSELMSGLVDQTNGCSCIQSNNPSCNIQTLNGPSYGMFHNSQYANSPSNFNCCYQVMPQPQSQVFERCHQRYTAPSLASHMNQHCCCANSSLCREALPKTESAETMITVKKDSCSNFQLRRGGSLSPSCQRVYPSKYRNENFDYDQFFNTDMNRCCYPERKAVSQSSLRRWYHDPDSLSKCRIRKTRSRDPLEQISSCSRFADSNLRVSQKSLRRNQISGTGTLCSNRLSGKYRSGPFSKDRSSISIFSEKSLGRSQTLGYPSWNNLSRKYCRREPFLERMPDSFYSLRQSPSERCSQKSMRRSQISGISPTLVRSNIISRKCYGSFRTMKDPCCCRCDNRCSFAKVKQRPSVASQRTKPRCVSSSSDVELEEDCLCCRCGSNINELIKRRSTRVRRNCSGKYVEYYKSNETSSSSSESEKDNKRYQRSNVSICSRRSSRRRLPSMVDTRMCKRDRLTSKICKSSSSSIPNEVADSAEDCRCCECGISLRRRLPSMKDTRMSKRYCLTSKIGKSSSSLIPNEVADSAEDCRCCECAISSRRRLPSMKGTRMSERDCVTSKIGKSSSSSIPIEVADSAEDCRYRIRRITKSDSLPVVPAVRTDSCYSKNPSSQGNIRPNNYNFIKENSLFQVKSEEKYIPSNKSSSCSLKNSFKKMWGKIRKSDEVKDKKRGKGSKQINQDEQLQRKLAGMCRKPNDYSNKPRMSDIADFSNTNIKMQTSSRGNFSEYATLRSNDAEECSSDIKSVSSTDSVNRETPVEEFWLIKDNSLGNYTSLHKQDQNSREALFRTGTEERQRSKERVQSRASSPSLNSLNAISMLTFDFDTDNVSEKEYPSRGNSSSSVYLGQKPVTCQPQSGRIKKRDVENGTFIRDFYESTTKRDNKNQRPVPLKEKKIGVGEFEENIDMPSSNMISQPKHRAEAGSCVEDGIVGLNLNLYDCPRHNQTEFERNACPESDDEVDNYNTGSSMPNRNDEHGRAKYRDALPTQTVSRGNTFYKQTMTELQNPREERNIKPNNVKNIKSNPALLPEAGNHIVGNKVALQKDIVMEPAITNVASGFKANTCRTPVEGFKSKVDICSMETCPFQTTYLTRADESLQTGCCGVDKGLQVDSGCTCGLKIDRAQSKQRLPSGRNIIRSKKHTSILKPQPRTSILANKIGRKHPKHTTSITWPVEYISCSEDKTMSNDSDCVDKDCAVRVAVRIRPQNSREVIDMCRNCTTVIPNEPQVVLGQDKAFTFDHVFDGNSNQNEIYAICVERLVEGALHGYNATVLAYGQTGSGKTFTMGTGFEREINTEMQGIIPRAVTHIFAGIKRIQSEDNEENGTSQIDKVQFSVAVQFMELYNEEIVDLLDPFNRGRISKIHEDGNGQISVTGITIKPIHGPHDALTCLQQGALARTTASTQMNDQSSRSHALFTILIRRQRIISSGINSPEEDLETLTSKFNFVDLAGSERLKRTGATGERAREGISINCGLLALGNCISALGDKAKKATHIPYRDSKLTRLLQDSLGGNSQTLMIACVSPSDRDFMETLNTLKYANRARNIKNKVQLNQDHSSRTISQLRREIAELQMELLEFKQGKRHTDAEGNSSLSDTYHENAMLLADNKRLQQRLKAMQETINVLTEKNAQLRLEHETHGWPTSVDSDRSVTNMVAGYLSEIEKLQAKLIESEEMYQQLKKNNSVGTTPRGITKMKMGTDDAEGVINLAKRELEKNRELVMSRSLPGLQEDSNNCNNIELNPNDSCESDESDTESDDKTNEIQADLIDINSDIEIKTKLIEQLELSQQRMQLMRQHYEEKLNVLNSRIINTQKERDEVLANMGPSQSNVPNEKVKKVRDEYERKINDMQRELKKLQQAEREHVRQQREAKAQEVKLRNLRSELSDLKNIKTRLIRKMTEQTNRHKEEETRKSREIAQLRKVQRRQENTVKTLQAQMHAKDQILKRKTEEVSALRRSQRGSLSRKAAGRVLVKNSPSAVNARLARQHWDKLNRAISRAARNRQVVVQLEKELERLMNEREILSHDLTTIRSKQKTSKNVELASEEDTIKSNLNYVQENIAHVQQAIMDFEETKETTTSSDSQNLQDLINNIHSVDEAKFLLERLTDATILFSCNSSLTQSRLLEHEALLKEAQQESGIQQQLLQHFLAQNNAVQISDLFESLNIGGAKLNAELSGSQKSLISNGTYDIPSETNITGPDAAQQRSLSRSPSPTPTIDLSYDKNAKVRKRTAQPQDLLFGDGEISHNGADVMTRSFTQQEHLSSHMQPLMRVPSAPGSLRQSFSKKNVELSSNSTATPQSPRLTRRVVPNKGSPGLEDDAANVVMQSPPVYRKFLSREEAVGNSDVFSRLGAGTQDPPPGGSIHKVSGKIRAGVPLYCTHTVSGHNNSVLSIKVDDNILYTAAADRTVKVWDLSREVAQHCLSSHPGPVIAVQNDCNTGLLFSASGPYVRVWDLRTSNTKPIKTLTSSGQILSGNANVSGVVSGESPITALCLGASGNLYMAASDKVRIWDVKNFACIGKLSGGHQAAVMCVTSWEGDDGSTDFVATGSKDHYVKVFEVPRVGGVVYPLLNLEPPHYDGVQALVVAQDAVGADAELFSGSRDSGIKRWDLKTGELKQSLNNAHKGWVSGMSISGDILLSGCRGGIIRLWNVKTCENLAEMKTDLMINDIVAAGQRVFTASSEGNVRIWRLTNALRRHCSLDSNPTS